MPRRVLLIDDDRLQCKITAANIGQFWLEKFEVDWVDNYEAGLQKLMHGDYSVCLLDYQLGERDGLMLLREAQAAGCRIPIIFLTAENDEKVDMQAMEAGAIDYLIKGEINPRTLERTLRYALKLSDALEAMRQLATHDQLTGLLNRREFERIISEEHERAKRFGRSYAILMIDLDHFKSVNDRYGHPAGDHVLQTAAKRIRQQLRSVDRCARIGGEEFAVVLTEVDHVTAGEVARRIVEMMAAMPVTLSDGTKLTVTLSAGSASMPKNASDIVGLVKIADKALYEAKARGRKRAVAAVEMQAC
jgi:two-component system cell cycle response regulator